MTNGPYTLTPEGATLNLKSLSPQQLGRRILSARQALDTPDRRQRAAWQRFLSALLSERAGRMRAEQERKNAP